jgi:hypothetical protein
LVVQGEGTGGGVVGGGVTGGGGGGETCTGGTSVKFTDGELLPPVAVNVAFWADVTEVAVAVKVELDAPEGIRIEFGTCKEELLLNNLIERPEVLFIAELRLIAHVSDPGVFSAVEEHIRPTCGIAGATVIVAPDPVSLTALPSPSAATRPEICIGIF